MTSSRDEQNNSKTKSLSLTDVIEIVSITLIKRVVSSNSIGYIDSRPIVNHFVMAVTSVAFEYISRIE